MDRLINHLSNLSAVFCLSGSPFQAMCMIEAISNFEIKDYRVLLCLSHSELPRKQQLVELLEKYGIKYEIESVDFQITKQERLKALLPNRNTYKLAFIGDCNNELLIFKAFRYVSDGGTIVYLDDGIATIQFFNGLCQLSGKFKKYYSLISKLRHIDFDRFFYTIYRGLDDKKHLSIANNFSFLSKKHRENKPRKQIIVLGTCTDDYCRMERIETSVFLNEQKKLIEDVKQRYPDDKIIFVPHGRDVYSEPRSYCAELGVSYTPTSISVEMFLLEAPFTPKAIFGFTSSALYNLRLLIPESEIVNISFIGNSPQNDRIEITSRYFAQNGIKREVRQLNTISPDVEQD